MQNYHLSGKTAFNGKTAAEFLIRQLGVKVGKIIIRPASISWKEAGRRKTRRLSWSQFANRMR